MERKTKRIPHVLLKSPIQRRIMSDQRSISSNMTSPHFKIHVTEFTQNRFGNTECSDRTSMSTNIRSSVSRLTQCSPSPSISTDNESAGKKQIKMSAETPSKRVILVLPNGSSSVSELNRHNGDVSRFRKHSDIKIHSPDERKKESSVNLSNKSNGNGGFNHTKKVLTMNSNTEINTDEGFHETPIPGEVLMNNKIDKREDTNDSITLPFKRLRSSSGIFGNDATGQHGLTTSTPKVQRNLTQKRQIVNLKKLSKSNLFNSKNTSPIRKLRSSTSESLIPCESRQQENKPVVTSATENDTVMSSSAVLSNKEEKAIDENLDSSNLFRKIKINGLTLKAIDPLILKDSRFKEKIKILTRSRLDKLTSNQKTSDRMCGAVQNGSTMAVESSQGIEKKDENCENCKRLQSEISFQRQIISNLKCNLIKSTASTSKQPLLPTKDEKEELKSKILKKMDDINKQLMEDLRKERIYNSKLRMGLVNRDKHIEKLESELTHVSKIFEEMGAKSTSMKKLINNSFPPTVDEEFSDFLSINHSDVDSSPRN